MLRLFLPLVLGLICLLPPRPLAAQALVAAASDLQFALQELAERFQSQRAEELRLVFGSSGNLTRQIESGAPFELFLSADETYVFRLAKNGHLRDEGLVYALGHLALFIPPGSPLSLDGNLSDLREAAEGGRLKRFAIANPEHAPYGRAARQALQAAGAWEAIRPRLVTGENVSQAAQFASTSSDGGLIAYSLAASPNLEGRGEYAPVPQDMHQPLRQRMALTKNASPTAEAFYDYLQGPEAQEIFQRYGFSLPDEAE